MGEIRQFPHRGIRNSSRKVMVTIEDLKEDGEVEEEEKKEG